MELIPFGYKSSIGRLEPLIATEDVEVRTGEVQIGIEKVNLLLPVTSFSRCSAGITPLGMALDVASSDPPKKVEDDKKVDSAGHALSLKPAKVLTASTSVSVKLIPTSLSAPSCRLAPGRVQK